MQYRVNNIGIEIQSSTPDWNRQSHRALQRQLTGFEMQAGSEEGLLYRINLHDYERLTTSASEDAHSTRDRAQVVVPGYSYYSAGLFVDEQQRIAMKLSETALDVWCSAGCRGISVPFLLQVMLLKQDKTLVHAAALDVKGSGILLPAFGGIGKTMLVAKAAQIPGVKVLGDDMVILTKDGMLEPYLRPFVLYEYHKSLFPEFFTRERVQYKPTTLSWRIFNRLRSVMGQKLGRDWHQSERVVRTGYLPVAPARVLPPSALATQPARLDRVCVLGRSGVDSNSRFVSLEPETACRFMLNVMYHEWYGQLRFLLAWLTSQGVSFKEYLGHVEGILQSAVSKSRAVSQISIPIHLTPGEASEEMVRYVIQ